MCLVRLLLIYKISAGQLFLLVMWVDNIYYFATTSQLSTDFETIMESNFQITKSDEATNLLGMVCQHNFDKSKTLLMPRIQEKLFEECFGNTIFKTSLTPMSPTFSNEDADNAQPLSPTEITRQRRLLGLILQLVPIRPDLSFPHSMLATRVQKATDKDFEALKRIVRYIAFTIPLGLTLHPSHTPTGASTTIDLTLYSDYSHNAHPDSKGHYGVGASIGDKSGLFYSKGGKLQVITDSTAAGEILCGVKICKQFDWLKSVIDTLGLQLQQPTPLRLDNKSMIAVCTKITGATKRLRHILLHINFILERVQNGQIQCLHLPTNEMIVDMITKPLAPTLHWQHMEKLLGSSEAMSDKLQQVHNIMQESEPIPTHRRKDAIDDIPTPTIPTAIPPYTPTTEPSAKHPHKRAHITSTTPTALAPPTMVQSVTTLSASETLLATTVNALSTAVNIIQQQQKQSTNPTAPSHTKRKPRKCFDFDNKGQCQRGSQCHFSHE